MQFSTLTFFTLAAVATAAPAEIEVRTQSGSCTNTQQQVCCTAGILACVVQVINSACTGQAYCCSNNSPVNSLINLDLSCTQLIL
ncbi:uncharacterized protein GGS25DRAFT_519440 [Hypoxylon fragiforme]|uniref:uncharacterized protein n=1 Tax=Hypoxylon fragiforme TaxID=63214 RepID=UPI0020C5D764|nr:uncharacterized protein GGS25DRAFT_519440 [Hypoxylon fragiforme]KAI2611143.1 hypothetical protein GGS25DRAFT_519440 [Hypoxylon fragiforme]